MSLPWSRGGSRRGRVGTRPQGLRLAVGRTATALGQWLRRPLTSLHLVLGVFGLLTLFGLVMVLSASSVESLSAGGSSYSVFTRQLMFCVPGLLMFWLGLRITPRQLRSLGPAALVIGMLSLVAVLFLGETRNGSRAWFAFGPFSFQPSEAVKVALTLWGAHVLVARVAVMHRWKYALSPVVPVTAVLLTLLVLQPDLGMTISLGIVLIALLFFGGAPMRLILTLSGGAMAGAVVLALTAEYRMSRITAFLSPESADPQQAGFQARQALYSLADGGLFGQGLGQGRAKWSYLPNAHNDFIFAIVTEELGFVGAFAVLALFATLAYTGFRIAARSNDPWLRLVVATSTTWLVAQAAINIGYVVGLLPVTGLQLPLISSGGTSLVVTMFVFGVLANAARHEPEAIAALKQHGQGRLARLVRLPLPQPYRAPVSQPYRVPAARAPQQRGRGR
ncbi:putative lipid II flippase FtsW [Pseudonocardia sp. MH-G8]|uniref:putative lipid II flippase FtsW n=1 Tax=Pseudonocardia sp. MH-G8 TaxID=1854588 RepID=UPI000BA10C24|nr:putative lipid II flippase FtsW [Pseudonocardia sp. MH-G8]OZM76333.1 putative lipid II flippase FtsW [Pseudonocardia sp. MH-G8]